MNKSLLFILFAFPALALADTYTGEAGEMQMTADFITQFWEYFESDVPDFTKRMLAYIFEKAVVVKLYIELETMKLAWSVAKQILANLEIASKITSLANALPQDIRAAIVDMRLFDALNIVLNAVLTRFIMRFL